MARLPESGDNQTGCAPGHGRWRALAESLGELLAAVAARAAQDELLSVVARRAQHALASQAAAVYRYRERVFCVETAQGSRADALPRGHLIPGEERLTRGAADPLFVTDLNRALASPEGGELSPSEREAFARLAAEYRAILALPLVVHGETFGALALYWQQPRRFAPDAVEFAAVLGAGISQALETAQRIDRLQAEVVVDERRRLAARVHDSVTQSLYSLLLHAQVGYERNEAGDLDAASALWLQVSEIAWEALKETRLLVYEMRPPVLEREGLVHALRSRLAAVERRSGIHGRVLVDGALEVPPHLEDELYWVALEALNNALKHAAATSVTVHLSVSDRLVELEVQDDGTGFDPDAVIDDSGVGLVTMRERVEALGGTLSLLTAPGQGTIVRARVEMSAPHHRSPAGGA